MSIVKAIKSSFKKYGQAPGLSQVVQTMENDEIERETEFWQFPGFLSGVTPNDRLQVIPLSGGGYRLIVSANNYKVGVTVQAGEVKIFSTDATGSTKKAEIYLDTDGKIKISNAEQSMKSIISDLIDEVSNLKTFGSPGNHLVDPSTKTNLTAIKTRWGGLFK